MIRKLILAALVALVAAPAFTLHRLGPALPEPPGDPLDGLPDAPAVARTGTIEIGRTYLFETRLETRADETAVAGAALPAELLPDGVMVRFSVNAGGIGVRVAGQGGGFASAAASGELRFVRGDGGTQPFRFEVRGEVPGPGRLKLSLYARQRPVLRVPLALFITRAGEPAGAGRPLPRRLVGGLTWSRPARPSSASS